MSVQTNCLSFIFHTHVSPISVLVILTRHTENIPVFEPVVRPVPSRTVADGEARSHLADCL